MERKCGNGADPGQKVAASALLRRGGAAKSHVLGKKNVTKTLEYEIKKRRGKGGRKKWKSSRGRVKRH